MAFDRRDLNIYISRGMIFLLAGLGLMLPVLIAFAGWFQKPDADTVMRAVAEQQKKDTVQVQIVGPDDKNVIIEDPNAPPKPAASVTPPAMTVAPVAPAPTPRRQ